MKKKNIKYEILKTSYELFKQSGYHNVSVLQICQACNISKPTFYKHVESKEKIISYYFQSIDQYIPDTWYKYGDNENHWEKIKQGYAYLIKQILTIGIDLYTENFICNLKSETPPLPNDFSFQDSMCDLIQEGQKSHQIQNMAPPIELYKMTRPRSLNCTSLDSRRWVPTTISTMPFFRSARVSFCCLAVRKRLSRPIFTGKASMRLSMVL